MRDKITRIKKYIQEHRTELAFESGLLVGAAAITAVVYKNTPSNAIWLGAPSESLQRLIDEPNGAISWTVKHRTIYLANDANTLL